MKPLRRLRYKVGARFREQTCMDCFRKGDLAVWFDVPDEVWATVMGKRQEVVCLTCFDRHAETVGFDYSRLIWVQGRRSWIAGLSC